MAGNFIDAIDLPLLKWGMHQRCTQDNTHHGTGKPLWLVSPLTSLYNYRLN